MKHILFLVVLLILAAPLTASGQTKTTTSVATGNDEKEILKALSDWAEALKRNDGPTLDRLVSDDFHIVLDDGQFRNKEQELGPSKSGDIKFESLTTDDVKVFISGDTAIVTGVAAFRGSMKGRGFEGRERFFDVYQKRNGRWLVLASRSTTLPMPK